MDWPHCAAVVDWLGATADLPPRSESMSKFWKLADEWDYAQANNQQLFENDPAKSSLSDARQLRTTDPEAAYQRVVALADTGSVSAMLVAAYCSGRGLGTPANEADAERWYRRAAQAGSLHAQLYYGKNLAKRGDIAGAETVFAAAVAKEWGPSLFWVAWYRLKHARTRAERLLIKPMLDRAADQGSPAAELILARSMAKGRFGLRFIATGARRLVTFSGRMLAKIEVVASATDSTP